MDKVSEALFWARSDLAGYGIKVSEYPHESNVLPWWYICQCGSRVALHLTAATIASGVCPHCDNNVSQELFSRQWKDSLIRTAPKIILHNLLNRSAFGYRAGVNHIGSAEHVLIHSLAMVRLARLPLPQLL